LDSPFFYGEFELVIDEKSRLICPAEVRRAINPEIHGPGFFLIVGSDHIPWLYPELYYLDLVAKIPTRITPSAVQQRYARLKYSMAAKVEPDKQGRMVVPDRALKRAGIEKEVTLIGAGDHLEIWDRQKWELERENLYVESDVIEQTMTSTLPAT
jgi:MraZ protein